MFVATQVSLDRWWWRDGTWFERFVFGLDDWLRRKYNVFEYTPDPDCVFRIQPEKAEIACRLSDGTPIRPGQPLLCLHMWNEHIPRMGPEGPTLAWALRFRRALDTSLKGLAAYLRVRPELDEFPAICGNMVLGTAEQTEQLMRLSERLGFEQVPMDEGRISIGEQLHRSGENFLALFFVMAVNPVSARLEILRRSRALIFMSRNRLMRLYGPGAGKNALRSH